MKRLLLTTVGALATVATLSAAAQQAAEKEALPARIDNPNIRAQYEEIRKSAVEVVPTPAVRQILTETRTTQVWILEAVIDRGALVSIEIPKGNESFLDATGAAHVQRAEDVGHNTIWGGKYFRLLPLADSTLDDDSLQKFSGMPMKFDVAMRSDGRQVIIDIRRP